MQRELLSIGTFRARAVPNPEWGGKTAELCYSNVKGTPYIGLLFEVQEGEEQGAVVRHELYMSAGARDRSIESLIHCGWNGEDLDDLSTVGSKDCQIVVNEETYKGQIRIRVQWVNAIGAAGVTPGPMSAEARKTFAASMRGAVHKVRAKMGGAPAAAPPAPAPRREAEAPPITDDDLKF